MILHINLNEGDIRLNYLNEDKSYDLSPSFHFKGTMLTGRFYYS